MKKALFEITTGDGTKRLLTLDVASNQEAHDAVAELYEALTPVSDSKVRLMGVWPAIQEASSLFEAYELAMTSDELGRARKNRAHYDETFNKIG